MARALGAAMGFDMSGLVLNAPGYSPGNHVNVIGHSPYVRQGTDRLIQAALP